jgi:hypothetical protein
MESEVKKTKEPEVKRIVRFKNKVPRRLGFCTGHRLTPGKNQIQELEMTDRELAEVLRDPGFKSWQRLGWVTYVPGKPAVKESRFEEVEEFSGTGQLQDMNVREAKAEIKVTSDADQLAAWHSKDSRKAVKEAIVSRMKELTDEEESAED